MNIYDFIIIGTGPSAFGALSSLNYQKKNILILESGPEDTKHKIENNYKNFNDFRNSETNQFKSLYSDKINMDDSSIKSPKLETVEYLNAQTNYRKHMLFNEINFKATYASLYGGLSNFWGSGIACYSENELQLANLPTNEMRIFYELILKKIPVANNINDDLNDYFGIKDSSEALRLSKLSQIFYDNYIKSSKKIQNMSIGRPRLSVNLSDSGEMKKCSYRGSCLYGCQNNSIFNSKNYINNFILQNNTQILFSQHVSHINSKNSYNEVVTNRDIFYGKNIIVASGTISTTKIIHKSLNYKKKVKLVSSPSAGFALYKPSLFNRDFYEDEFFGLSQAAFKINDNEDRFFGAIFDPKSLPLSKFATYLPFSLKSNFHFSRYFLKNCLFGNIFFNGNYSNHYLIFNNDFTEISINGGYSSNIHSKLNFIKKNICNNFFKLGFFYVPTSLNLSTPGSDSHYSGTIKINDNFKLGDCDNDCKVYGLNNVFAVDGSVLNYLSEKSHTLTLMANAMRVVDKAIKKL